MNISVGVNHFKFKEPGIRKPFKKFSKPYNQSQNNSKVGGRSCYAYGSNKHIKPECKFKNSKCFLCRETGHLARRCLKKTAKTNVLEVVSLKVKVVGETLDDPWYSFVKINSFRQKLLFDTGARVTLLTKLTWKKMRKPKLMPTNAKGEAFTEDVWQVELDEESKKLVGINTHRGLFMYKRLSFGVKSAPSIFQK